MSTKAGVVLSGVMAIVCVAFAQGPADIHGKLAYVHNGDIWVKTLPDGAADQISQGGDAENPRWSRSGRWLSFTQKKKVTIVSMSGAAGTVTVDAVRGAWSPAVDELAFVDQDGVSVLRLEPVVQRKRVVFPKPDAGTVGGFKWNPDGTRLAVSLTSQRPSSLTTLWQVRSDGSEKRPISFARKEYADHLVLAGWSSDSRQILMWVGEFSASVASDGFALVSVSPDTGAVQNLTRNEVLGEQYFQNVRAPNGRPIQGGVTRTRYSGTGVLLYDEYISPSPSGNRLLVIAGEERTSWQNKRLTLVDPATGNISVLTDNATAVASSAWSPNGSMIAYAAGPEEPRARGGEEARKALWQRRIWIMNANGGNPQQLTSDPLYRDEYPVWSHDGQHLVFLRMDEENRISAWSVRVGDGKLVKLVDEIAGPPVRGTWFGFYGHLAWPDFIALQD